MTTAKQYGKIAANRGVPRNKKPLQNILYRFEVSFIGYDMYWAYERDFNRHGTWNFHGYVTEDEIRQRLSTKQWTKFRNGETRFIKQRRINGRNIPKV